MTYSDITTDIDFLVKSDSTTYPIAQKTANVNRALDTVVSAILGADGRWQWDDTNYTDLPIGVTDLVSGQQDYSFDTEYLVLTRLEVQDSDGKWRYLTPIDQNDLNYSRTVLADNIPGYTPVEGQSLTDFLSTPGKPVYYDKIASSVFLYPKPNYNLTGGLKAYFQRKADYFTVSDTTKEPGFAKHLHRYLSLSAAYDFALTNGLAKASTLRQELSVLEQKITDFYAYRPKDEKVIIRPHVESWR